MELELTWNELLVIDWVLCYPTQQPTLDLSFHQAWDPLRRAVWAAVETVEEALKDVAKEARPTAIEKTPAILWVEEEDAAKLLSLVPTTHRWGTGLDCGFSLKRKLAVALRKAANLALAR